MADKAPYGSVQDIAPRYRRWFLLLMLTPALLVWRELNNDLWFLLNYGRYVLNQGFPTLEPFTLHDNFSFVMQQWLSGVLFWLTYDTFGPAATLVLTGLAYALTLLVLYKLAMLVSEGHFLVSFAVTMFSSIGLYQFMVTRPYIFSTLILALEVYCLELYVVRGRRLALWLLPVLSLLLVNLHAALWPMLFVLALPWLIDAAPFQAGLLAGQGYPAWPLAGALLASVVTALANPYGLKALTYLFRSFGYPEINALVMEMKVFDIKQAGGLFFYGFVALSLAGYWLDRQQTIRLRYILLTGGLLVLALASARSFMLYAGLAQFPLAYLLREWGIKRGMESKTALGTAKRGRQKLLRLLLIGLSSVLVFEFVLIYFQPAKHLVQNPQLQAIVAELPAPDQMTESVLYTGYNEGAYVEFLGYRPYIDARAEVFTLKNNHQKDVFSEYYQLQSGTLHYREFLDQYQFTHLLLGHKEILRVYLAADPDYQLIATQGEYQLYIRR